MYEYIVGDFIGINRDYVVIENNGIGYRVFTSGGTIAGMPKVGEKVTLFLEQIVREDFIGLYGFLTKEELDMFKLLLTINGVGAKAALSLLSISTVVNLKYAIIIGDEKQITRAPGIGKKIAQRIILELKDKLNSEDLIKSNDINVLVNDDIYASNLAEALGALIALGYTEKEAQKVLQSVDKSDTLENMIKNCLKMLMN
ncbi:Holliday junction ATP-dependent DNA helicase RuvA [Clostridium polyendosporum]|uniref:Holliday junction branch migration complex subunit RuvA n=1 Tax=Clostridium polyendosporum TaxID=69208 RepID=A0A919S004_9CLOT|nr:Holliday junction branch migration protein RuvA [Clostridium polyendosporum]GIM28630.1 Holliday junction ATP-dependent DNA helicase RuvA [Clostridium polyendosporum]